MQLGIVGGGAMGEALLSGVLNSNIFSPSAVLVSEPQPQRRDFLHQQYGVAVTADNQQVVTAEQGIILAVKPQILSQIVPDLTQDLNLPGQPLLISILAGVTLTALEQALPGFAIIRAMPNTPALIGSGITAITPGSGVRSEQKTLAQTIFTAVGQVVEVPENLLDAVTAVSGSGPAYVAILVEAMADGGVAAGLPRALSLELALQTVFGTADLLQQTQRHPAQLKDQVSSPGGTTIAAIAQLEAAGFRSGVIKAVLAAQQRAQELGRS